MTHLARMRTAAAIWWTSPRRSDVLWAVVFGAVALAFLWMLFDGTIARRH